MGGVETGPGHHGARWQLNLAEIAGLVAPTVVASKEPFTDAETGLDGMRKTPIPDRIDRGGAARRFVACARRRIRRSASRSSTTIIRLAREMIGASYLNVLPKSLWQILRRLEKDGYDASGAPASEDGLLQQYATRAAISAIGIPAVWNNWSATGSRKKRSPCCQ